MALRRGYLQDLMMCDCSRLTAQGRAVIAGEEGAMTTPRPRAQPLPPATAAAGKRPLPPRSNLRLEIIATEAGGRGRGRQSPRSVTPCIRNNPMR